MKEFLTAYSAVYFAWGYIANTMICAFVGPLCTTRPKVWLPIAGFIAVLLPILCVIFRHTSK